MTKTGGRGASLRHIFGSEALSVGMPKSAPPLGWRWVSLTEVARLESGHTPSRRHTEYWGGDVPWLSIRDAKTHHGGMIFKTIENTNDLGIKNSSARVLPEGTVCLSRTASVGYVVVLGCPMATSQDFVNWVCSSKLEPRFLQYLLLFEKPSLGKFSSGAVHQTIYFPEVKAFHICLPDVEEQRRIVAVLDKTFEDIATAMTNAQKNLTNARALFDSYLDSLLSHRDDDWVNSRLGNVATLQRGFDLPTQDRVAGSIPLVSSSGITARISESRVTGPGVTTGRSGSIGNVFYIDEPYWPLNTSLYVKNFNGNHPRFVFWLLRHFDLGKYATGSGVPTLNRNFVHDEEVWIPSSREAQIKIAQELDELDYQCDKLKELATTKLAALTELKQSLLQKAFAGELTSALATPTTLVANDIFVTPQGTAHIIAFAYRRHQLQSQQQTYGRVKAQKSLHLVESVGGIDLGRWPMKDAAGPNDFPHMLRAEEWAEAQGFFKFVPRASGNGYDFKKLANYDTLWADAVAATKPVAAALEKAIDPIVPMVSLDAEVFATVHAAWNNLIRDGVVITDDTIVEAARDDWHWAKLKIPEHKFRDAIRTIKAKNMEPDGSAKYVGGQAKLI